MSRLKTPCAVRCAKRATEPTTQRDAISRSLLQTQSASRRNAHGTRSSARGKFDHNTNKSSTTTGWDVVRLKQVHTVTGRACPRRYTLPTACFSRARFSSCSRHTTLHPEKRTRTQNRDKRNTRAKSREKGEGNGGSAVEYSQSRTVLRG